MMEIIDRLTEAPVALLVLVAASMPMLVVHSANLYGVVLTNMMRSIMRRGFPLAAVAASIALFVGADGVLYACAIIVPFLQWHVVRFMYDWYVGKNCRAPRSYGYRSLDGDTPDEFTFSLASGLGVFALPPILMMSALLIQRVVS